MSEALDTTLISVRDELVLELSNLVSKISSGADSAAGFFTEQTPEVLRQLVLWYGIRNGILCFTGVIFVAILITVNYYQYRGAINKYETWVEMPVAKWYNTLQILFVIPLSGFLNLTWLKICIAPKVWLLEYIIELAKTTTTT